MTQVSWTRILQRAGDELPSEGGAAIINMQDRAAERQKASRQPMPQERNADDLESDLRHALDRAAQRGRVANLPRPVPQPPSQAGGRARPHAAASRLGPGSPYMRAPLTQLTPVTMAGPAKRRGSGARNLIAISLSVAVVAFALHRIGTEWAASQNEKTETGDGSAAGARSASALYTGPVGQDAPNQAQVRRNASNADAGIRMELRPSLAPADGAEKSPAPSGRAEAALGNEWEEAMLRRGHELMDRGYVSGARLIFEHLAEQKSALGAFALAQSYDPKILTNLPVQGVQPDEMQAAYWYQRAAQLGTLAAAVR